MAARSSRFEPPVGSEARAIGRTGIDPRTARSLLVGLINFPEALPEPCRGARRPALRRPQASARVRDDLVDRAYSGAGA